MRECTAELSARLARLARRDSSGTLSVRLTGADVDRKLFTATRIREGYDQKQVDELLGLVRDRIDELDRELIDRGVLVEGGSTRWAKPRP